MYESIIKTRTNFIKTETKQHKVESELMKLVMAKKVRIRKSGNRSFSFVHTISSAFCRIRIETENCWWTQRTINVSWNMKQGYSVSNRHTQRAIDREMEWVKSIHANTYFDGINMPNRPLNSISLADKLSVEEVNWANAIAHLLYFLDDEEVPYFRLTKKMISCEILNYRPSHSFTIKFAIKLAFVHFSSEKCLWSRHQTFYVA